jgi:spore maturation protein CgeB
MIRILMVEPGPQFSVADVHHGWRRAFEQLGCAVVNFNLADRLAFYGGTYLEQDGEWRKALDDEGAVRLAVKGLQSVAYETWPHIVFVTSGFFVEPALYDLLRARGHKLVLNHLECPYEDNRQMARAGYVDVNLINDPTNLESFRAVNPQTFYLPAAHDPAVHRPGPRVEAMASDFCFVGTGFPSRVEFFEQVDWAGIDVALAGNWQATDPDSPLRKFVAHDIAECCDNTEAVGLYQSAKMSANLYRQEAESPSGADGWAMSPREVELAATGTFFLREKRGEGDEVLGMLPTFDSPGRFQSLLRYHLARPEVCRDLAERARAAVAGRTFVENAKRLLRLLAD